MCPLHRETSKAWEGVCTKHCSLETLQDQSSSGMADASEETAAEESAAAEEATTEADEAAQAVRHLLKCAAVVVSRKADN